VGNAQRGIFRGGWGRRPRRPARRAPSALLATSASRNLRTKSSGRASTVRWRGRAS